MYDATLTLHNTTVPDRVFKHLCGMMDNAFDGSGYSLRLHGLAVGDAAAQVMAVMGYAELSEQAFQAGLFHDIGKVELPKQLLWSHHRFSVEERKMMATHPELGHDILQRWLAPTELCAAALYHHTHFNGEGGYPDCDLRGPSIPLLARVVAICDHFHARIEHRLYREAENPCVVWSDMQVNANTWFDPELLQAFEKTNFFAESTRRAGKIV